MADEAAVALNASISGKNGCVLGGLVLVVILVFIIPVGVLLSGAVGAGLLGWLLKESADDAGDPVWRELNN